MGLCPKCSNPMYTIENKNICITCNDIYDIDTLSGEKWWVTLYEKHEQWNTDNCMKIPYIIRTEYLRIFNLLKEKKLHGAFFEIKDVFEILLKVPVLIVASEFTNKSELSRVEEHILFKLFEKDIAIGDWETICGLMKKLSKYEPINIILDMNFKLYTGNLIAKWRNDWIGHSALALEANPNFIKELKDKVDLLNVYFKKTINEYEKIMLIIDSDKYKFQIDGQAAEEFGYFIKIINGSVHLFDSYRNRKTTTAYLDYYQGDKVEIDVKEVRNAVLKLQINDKSREFKKEVSDSTLIVEQDNIIKEISGINDFLRPDFMKEHIDNFIKNNTKGIMLIRMKRGMGKSTLSMALDEQLNNKMKLDDCSVRAYYINDTYASRVSNFTSTINDIFRQDRDGKILIRGDIPLLSNTDINPSEEFSKLLRFYNINYNETHGKNKLVMIFDGIDEIKQYEGRTIFDFIPNYEQLSDNVYIICTCRTHDEIVESNFLTSNISNLDVTYPLIIEERSTDYSNLLTKYLKKKKKDILQVNIDIILKLSLYNFQGLKRITNYLEEQGFDLHSLQDINKLCEYEISSVFNKFGDKHFNRVLKILLLLASSEEPLSISQVNEFIFKDSNLMEAIFFLRAIKDLLRVDRNMKGNKITIIDKNLSNYLRQQYDAEILKLLDDLLKEFILEINRGNIILSESRLYLYSNIKSITEKLGKSTDNLFNDQLLENYCTMRDKFDSKNISNILDAIKIDDQILYIIDKIGSEENLYKILRALTYSNQAELYELYGLTNDSETRFGTSLTIFKGVRNLSFYQKKNYYETCIKYSFLQMKLGQYGKVIEILTDLANKIEKEKYQNMNTDMQSTIYCNRSIAYQNIEEYNNAKLDLNKAISILDNSKSLNDIQLRYKASICYLNRAVVNLHQGDLQDALVDITESLRLSSESDTDNKINKARGLMNYVNIKMKLGDTLDLFLKLDEAIRISEKLKSENLLLEEDILIKIYNNKGLLLSKENKNEDALSYYIKAATMCETLKKQNRYYYEEELCRSYTLIAELYELDGKNEKVIECYERILLNFNFNNYNSLDYALCAWNNLYADEGYTSKTELNDIGINWLKTLLFINWNIDTNNIDHIYSMAIIIHDHYNDLQLYDQAKDIVSTLLSILNKLKIPNIDYKAYCMKQIGFCFVKKNKVDEGLEMYDKSIALWGNIPYKVNVDYLEELVIVCFNRAMIYFSRKEYQNTYNDLVDTLNIINYCLSKSISIQQEIVENTAQVLAMLIQRSNMLGITVR